MKKIITILLLTLVASIGFAKAKIHCLDNLDVSNGIKACTVQKDIKGKNVNDLSLIIFPNNHYSIVSIVGVVDMGNNFDADYELN